MINIDKSQLLEWFPVKRNYLYFNFAADGPLPVPSKAAVCDALGKRGKRGQSRKVKKN